MHSGPMKTPSIISAKRKGLHALLRELSDDEEDVADIGVDVPDDPQRPWYRDFCAYMDTIHEQVPEAWTAIQWWGVSKYYKLNFLTSG